MNNTFRVRIRQRGLVTLPKELRDRNHIAEGDWLTVMDLGNDVLIMSPQRSRVNEIADRLAREWQDSGVSLESMLTALREVRGNKTHLNSK